MKNILLVTTILFTISLQGISLIAASSNAEILVANEKTALVKAGGKHLRKKEKQGERLERFSQKVEKKMAKLKKKGRFEASFDLNTIGLIVLALGGLFIFLGIIIPIIGVLFIVIGAIIAFVGLVMLLLFNSVKFSAGKSSH